MPSTMKIIAVLVLLITGILTLTGCGDSDATSTFDPETSVHPPDWLPAKHMFEARDDLGSCRQCHGEDLISGGISRISCDACHLGGPTNVHPIEPEWQPWIERHGDYTVGHGTSSCRNIWCHGPQLEGVPESGPSCSTCHPFAG